MTSDIQPTPSEQFILDSFTASGWLKEAIRSSLKRDILDAWQDAEILSRLLEVRFNKVIQGVNE